MIHIVKGDDADIFIHLHLDEDLVQEVTFNCPDLGIKKEAHYDVEFRCFTLKLPAEETGSFSLGFHRFSVALKFIDGQQFTPMPEGIVEVLRNREVKDE